MQAEDGMMKFPEREPLQLMDVFPEGYSQELENKHVNYEGLKDYLRERLSKVAAKGPAIGVADGDILNLVILCQMLWNEKENWRGKFFDMAKRYNDHLDGEIATYKKLLGRA